GDHRVLERAHVAEQVVKLEHESHVATPKAREAGLAAAGQGLALAQDPPPPPPRKRASPPSPRPARSSPWNRPRPAVGRSSPPRRCSSVDFPTPEAPLSVTNSPGSRVTLAPRRTRTASGPVRYSFSSSSPARSATGAASLIPEHVDRDQRPGAPGRNDRGQERQEQGCT